MYYQGTQGMNLSDIMQSVRLVSSTKDSLYVQWSIRDVGLPYVTGYKVTYQAVGSSVRQERVIEDQTRTNYDIKTLHEDTNYKVCVEVFTRDSSVGDVILQCIEASTATDSLSVALGSTFGAFLVLAIIVMFVFVAKWQHTRKQRKQRERYTPSAGSLDSMVQVDPDYEMNSDISLHVHEDTFKLEFSSQSSVTHDALNGTGTLHGNRLVHGMSCDGDDEGYVECGDQQQHHQPVDGYVTVHEPPDGSRDPCTSRGGALRAISVDMADGPSCSYRQPTSQPSFTLPPVVLQNSDDRPPDVRPKEKALMDLTHMYANKKLFEQPQTQLRPNLSCNW